jgi:hypothetical protein
METTPEESQVLSMIGLYQKDPEAFERMRAEIIQRMIDGFPEEYRRRAQGMQFQLEMRLKRFRNPDDRMNAMIGMFWEQFEEFNRVLNDPGSFLVEREAERHPPGKILDLKGYRNKH